MVQIDQTLPENLKFLFIGSILIFLLLILAALAKRLFFGKKVSVPSPLFLKTTTILISIGFAGLVFSLIFSTVTLARFHSSFTTIDQKGQRMDSNYPKGEFYYGLFDLADDLRRLFDALNLKCRGVSELNSMNFLDYFYSSQKDEKSNENGLIINISGKLNQQFEKLKSLVIATVGSCSSSEQNYLQKIQDTIQYVYFCQNRFEGTLFTLANKISIILVIAVISVPIITLIFVYFVLKLRKSNNLLHSSEQKAKSLPLCLVFTFGIISLGFIFGFGGAMLISSSTENAALNVRQVYDKHFLKLNKQDGTQVKQFEPPSGSEIQALVKEYKMTVLEILSKNSEIRFAQKSIPIPELEGLFFRTDQGIQPGHSNYFKRQTEFDQAFESLENLLAFKDTVDELLKWIAQGINGSNLKPLMLGHLDNWHDIFGKGLFTPAAFGIGFAVFLFILHSAQIIGYM